MRIKILSGWSGDGMLSIIDNLYSKDKQKRDMVLRLFDVMDIHHGVMEQERGKVRK